MSVDTHICMNITVEIGVKHVHTCICSFDELKSMPRLWMEGVNMRGALKWNLADTSSHNPCPRACCVQLNKEEHGRVTELS